MRQRGFTLLELLAVLVLISIAMTLLMTGMARGLSVVQERQGINELVQTLRHAHSLAITEQRSVHVTLDLGTLCYSIEARAKRCLSQSYIVTARLTASGSTRESDVAFYADGSSSGGNMEIRTPARTVRVDISWLTGNAVVVTL